MSIECVIRDATISGQIIEELRIALASELTTIRQVISARVRVEVERYNQQLSQREDFHGLVPPSDAELTLNGFKRRQTRDIDPEQQIAATLTAFERSVFFVLVDHEQWDDLDQEVLITPTTTISFITLTPLAGG
jgi:hypothetical protein